MTLRIGFELLLAVFAMSLLAGCSQSMLSTIDSATAPDGTCHADAGAYHIPKRLLTVTIRGSAANYSIDVSREKLVGEPQIYCLDFLFSAFSDDRVGIERTDKLLLKRIYTSADDRTKDVANAVIQATGDLIAASQARSFNRSAQAQIDGGTDFFQVPFDPFDRRDVEEINVALRPFGYCLHLDRDNDPFVPSWSSRAVCSANAETSAVGLKSSDPGQSRNGRQLMQHGVLYRPELSHRLVVWRKRDPGNPREKWHLAASEYVTMPNGAPLFALGINRALFVKAETDVEFQEGLLRNVTLKKPSELNAFVDIPLYAAQVALSIPAASLAIFENEAKNREALWKTHAELIKTLRELKSEKLRDEARASGGGSLTAPIGLVDPGRSGDATAEVNRLISYEACLRNSELIGARSPEEVCKGYAGIQ